MKHPDVNKIAEHYAAILKEIGADLESEGMKETPLRCSISSSTAGERLTSVGL